MTKLQVDHTVAGKWVLSSVKEIIETRCALSRQHSHQWMDNHLEL